MSNTSDDEHEKISLIPKDIIILTYSSSLYFKTRSLLTNQDPVLSIYTARMRCHLIF